MDSKSQKPIINQITSFEAKTDINQTQIEDNNEPYLLKKALQAKNNKQQSDEVMVGPAVKRFDNVTIKELAFENLPSAKFYERSYMHKDIVNHIICSNISDYIVTCSTDGMVKFWKKVFHLIEFVRQFKAHKGLINGASLDTNHHKLVTVSESDMTMKIFDVLNFDMINHITINFPPWTICYYKKPGFDSQFICVSSTKNGEIYLYEDDPNPKDEPKVIEIHSAPVNQIKFNHKFGTMISSDINGFIEYWDPNTLDIPSSEGIVSFKSKFQTDLFFMVKNKTWALSITISPSGKLWGLMTKDRRILLFDFKRAKIVRKINNDIKRLIEIQNTPVENIEEGEIDFRLEHSDFDRKMVTEREIDKAPDHLININMAFDDYETFFMYPTIFGVNFYDIAKKKISHLVGHEENTERFIN